MESWRKDHEIVTDLSNKRIKILNGQVPKDLNFFSSLARLEMETGCTKTIVYATSKTVPFWKKYGFLLEGKIDGYFSGQNAYLLVRYMSNERATSKGPKEADDIVTIAIGKPLWNREQKLSPSLIVREAQHSDIPALSSLFKQVFPRYPNPIFDQEYLKAVLEQHLFMVIEHDRKLISVCSAEINEAQCCAEITDCATDPDYRGHSLLGHLLVELEKRLENRGIFYLFSLTRALSAAMNISIAKQGFVYRGRLINNCDIYSGFEDMNIWVKPLKLTWD